ncbi:hypothetical protein JZ751_001112 [Albula glossodonta]|uniref:Phosphoribulokinase/uridine kinase domain-containing protein n=1 Tax=Albula glossodonta TaxID=121402 RepID=A0A8T2PSS2_9TELE|nr:hypothetical protein JZ751_001112 [Albula glossodonta]
MKKLIIGIGGVTNGGKSTLAKAIHEIVPNSCIVAQDAYFKVLFFKIVLFSLKQNS